MDIILDLATAVDLARARSTSSYTVYIVRADLHAASHDPLPLSQQPAHSRGEGPASGQLLARLRANSDGSSFYKNAGAPFCNFRSTTVHLFLKF